MICWLTEVFVDIFFDNEKLWIVLFLEDKWTLDTNTRHVARIYIVCGKYVCLCVQAKTVCRYLRSETIISTALYIKNLFLFNFLSFLDKSTIILSKIGISWFKYLFFECFSSQKGEYLYNDDKQR